MASIAQSTTTKFPAIGQEGQKLSHPAEVVAPKIVDEATGLKPGRVVVPGTDPERDVSLPEALAEDADYFITTLATLGSASPQTHTTFTGVYDTGVVLNPPRNVTLTLANDADWDATTAVVTGLDAEGNRIQENLTIPNGGNATVAGVRFFSVVESILIPAQSGDASGTVGIGTEAGPLYNAGIVNLDLTQSNLFSGNTATTVEAFEDDDEVAVSYRGRVLVLCENAATAGGQVYVRLVAGGGEELGAIRSNADGTSGAPDCVPLHGWKFVSGSSTSNQLVEIARF